MYWNTASPYWSDELADPHFGLTDISGSLTDGFYTCTFHRESVTNIPIPSMRAGSSNKTYFDLDNNQYFLLLALGPVSSSSGTILKHTTTSVTGHAVDLTSFSSVGADQATMIKLHASFMILAWLLCANFGTFFARYCKDIFQVKHNAWLFLNMSFLSRITRLLGLMFGSELIRFQWSYLWF